MKTAEALQSLLEQGDAGAVAEFFRGMPELERREHGAHCAQWHQQIRRSSTTHLASAATRAVLCTGTFSDLAKLPRWTLPSHDSTFDVLADRRPPWIDQWVTHLLDDERHWLSWRLVRRLVREGLARKPDHPNYALGMISGINPWSRDKTSVKQRLDDDPELLQDEIYRLFEHEGGGENSLANCDRFGKNGWSAALLAFVDEGKLDRQRLLASCIEALRRDFNHYRAKWFATFYDKLEPSKDEQRASAEAFLALVSVSAPNIVAWAFKKVQAQAKGGAYTSEALLEGLAPVLEARSKGLAKSALKLLAQTVAQSPGLGPRAASIAVVALAHSDAEVQAAALDLIEVFGDRATLPGTLQDYVSLVAPSLRARLELLTGQAPASEPAAPRTEIESADLEPELRRLFAIDALLSQPSDGVWQLPAAIFDGTDLPRLAVEEPIAPIVDLDELIELSAQALEDALGPDDVERVLDGFSRLCDQRPDDFERRTAPLMKRVHEKTRRDYTPFAGEGPASDVCGLIHAWVSGEVATLERVKNQHGNLLVVVTLGGEKHQQHAGNLDKTLGALSRRAHALSHRVAARRAEPLLGAPTHTGCLIDPVALAERVNAWQGEPPELIDTVVALLRLAPERRARALENLKPSDDEWQRAVRHALGGATEIGTTLALWAAAARARAPWAADSAVCGAFPDAGPDVATPAVYDLRFEPDKHKRIRVRFPDELRPKELDRDCIPIVLHAERGDSMWELGGLGGRSEPSVRWTASAWPIARESFFAAALVQLVDNLDWWEARWYEKALLEPLLDPGTPLREMGLLLLATGLGAKEPGEHGLAIDAAVVAIKDGRLGSDNLGRGLSRMLGSGLIKAGRWAKTLADVARASDAHAAVVKLALEHCLSALENPPRDYVKLLELLSELSIQLELGVAGPHRAHLEAVKGANKIAKLAKALLQLPTEAGTSMQAAARSLSQERASSALRWQ